MSNLKVYAKTIEDEALEQINTLLSQDAFKDCKVRIMPDVHAGKGCVIGFTADLGNKVIPNIVGVDIGCGMLTVKLGNIDIDLKKLDEFIHENIPSGRNVSNIISDFNIFTSSKLIAAITYIRISAGNLTFRKTDKIFTKSITVTMFAVFTSGIITTIT